VIRQSQLLTSIGAAMRCSVILLVGSLMACGGGGDSSNTNGPSGSVSLVIDPQAVSVAAGATATITATATRSGAFNGAVTFSVAGLPSSVTVQSNTQVTAGLATTATITLAVVAGATAASATLTVSASGDGVTTATASLGLTITPPAGAQATLSFAQCAANLKPLWVAYRDGDSGAWTRVEGTADLYTFTLTQAKAGYAYVMPQQVNAASRVTTIFLGTRAEIASGGTPIAICTTTPLGPKTVTGSVAGVGPAEAVGVYLGGRFGVATAAAPSFTVSGIPTGTYDLVVTRSGGVPSASDRGIMRQNQDLATGTNLGVLDMSGPESFALATGSITVNGHPTGGILAVPFVLISGASCTASAITGYSPPASPFLMIGFPDNKIRATDMHMLTVISTSTVVGSRFVTEVFHTIGARTIDLPPELVPTVTPVAGSYKQLNATLNLPATYNRSTTLGYVVFSGGAQYQVALTATNAWLGTGSVSLLTPNFSGVNGWNDAWAPAANATASWTLTATGSDLAPDASLCTPGQRTRAASRSGSI
jgi:predicted lipoprotein with Yx(FWY)xxD motif